jgi:RNA polymerase sigma-70 factor (ECF subfamily)
METVLMPMPADGSSPEDSRSADASELDLTQLVHQYAGALFRYAYRLTGTSHDAEDLVQQTFAVAQQKLHTILEPNHVQAWLLTTLRRLFYKSLRKKSAMPASVLELDVATVPATDGDETVWDTELLQQALLRLPEVYRVVLLMFYFEEKSYQEIAEELDVPAGTVMSRLSRAKAQLRMVMTPEGKLAAAARPSDSASD